MAGLGTRLLPLTKAGPKSMVALMDRPALHHIVDEALQSEITDFCFIINDDDRQSIEYYFSPNAILDTLLGQKNKAHLLEQLNTTLAHSHFTYVTQPEPRGLGHAVLMGEAFVAPDTFFCVMLPDNIIESSDIHMSHLIAIAQKYNASVLTVEEVTREQVPLYAILTPKKFLTDNLFEVGEIVEKPQSDQVKSCLAQVGRYVFSSDIFESLAVISPGVDGEVQLTDAIMHMIQQGKRVLAYRLQGKRHDIGNIPGFLKTTVSLSLHNPLYRDIMRELFEQEFMSTH
jgi:UTP--glucose-1-phosphate uridylyltransferase